MAGNKTMPGGQSDMSTVEHEGPGTILVLLKHRAMCRYLSRVSW
jgi:hypothetical protein